MQNQIDAAGLTEFTFSPLKSNPRLGHNEPDSWLPGQEFAERQPDWLAGDGRKALALAGGANSSSHRLAGQLATLAKPGLIQFCASARVGEPVLAELELGELSAHCRQAGCLPIRHAGSMEGSVCQQFTQFSQTFACKPPVALAAPLHWPPQPPKRASASLSRLGQVEAGAKQTPN